MPRRCFIAGNWKMYKNVSEGRQFVETLESAGDLFSPGVEVVIFAPYVMLTTLRESAKIVKIGAQNLFYETEGAYTGEISPRMLQGVVDYVLIGHSERRMIFAETDTDVNRKIAAATANGLHPVVCVGETLSEREKGETFSRIDRQLEAGLARLPQETVSGIVFAYEPVWAIGTGRNATADQAQEVHRHIRSYLQQKVGAKTDITVIYGGSVKPENCADLLSRPDVDGFLVGGASLKVDSFSAIMAAAQNKRP